MARQDPNFRRKSLSAPSLPYRWCSLRASKSYQLVMAKRLVEMIPCIYVTYKLGLYLINFFHFLLKTLKISSLDDDASLCKIIVDIFNCIYAKTYRSTYLFKVNVFTVVTMTALLYLCTFTYLRIYIYKQI